MKFKTDKPTTGTIFDRYSSLSTSW